MSPTGWGPSVLPACVCPQSLGETLASLDWPEFALVLSGLQDVHGGWQQLEDAVSVVAASSVPAAHDRGYARWWSQWATTLGCLPHACGGWWGAVWERLGCCLSWCLCLPASRPPAALPVQDAAVDPAAASSGGGACLPDADTRDAWLCVAADGLAALQTAWRAVSGSSASRHIDDPVTLALNVLAVLVVESHWTVVEARAVHWLVLTLQWPLQQTRAAAQWPSECEARRGQGGQAVAAAVQACLPFLPPLLAMALHAAALQSAHVTGYGYRHAFRVVLCCALRRRFDGRWSRVFPGVGSTRPCPSACLGQWCRLAAGCTSPP